jgi:hypothetical protein
MINFLVFSFFIISTTFALRVPSELRSYIRFARHIPCPYVEDPTSAISSALSSSIVAQQIAISNITDAVNSWAVAMQDGEPRPLVLVLTGSTGTGKSETANVIANALLVSRISLEGGSSSSESMTPEGLIELRGEDYTNTFNITALQENIREAIATSLYQCRGHSVLIFDEAQKAAKGALAVLSPLLQGRRSKLRHPDLNVPLDATRMVIIIISDIGVPEIEQFIHDELAYQVELQPTKNDISSVSNVPKYDVGMLHKRLSIRMRQRLSYEFSSSSNGLDLGSLAEAIIPFMPFNHSGTQDLLSKELENYGNSRGFQLFADRLEWTLALTAYLSLPKFVRYSTDESSGTGSNRCASDLKTLSELRRSRKKDSKIASLSASADIISDGSNELDNKNEPVQTIESKKESSKVFSGSLVCGEPCEMPRSCLVRHGGRAISGHDDGPVKRIAKMLRRELQKLPGGKKKNRQLSESENSFSFLSNPISWIGKKGGDIMEVIGSHKETNNEEDDDDYETNNEEGDDNDDNDDGLVTIRLDVDCGTENLLDGTCSLRGVTIKVERCIETILEWKESDLNKSSPKKECSIIFKGGI